MIAVHELLADFDFQRSKVNFYELKSVVARLIDSIRYVREQKNPLGRRLVNYDLRSRAKSDTSRISIYLNARHQYTYIFICCFMYDRSTPSKTFLCAVLAFSVIYGRILVCMQL